MHKTSTNYLLPHLDSLLRRCTWTSESMTWFEMALEKDAPLLTDQSPNEHILLLFWFQPPRTAFSISTTQNCIFYQIFHVHFPTEWFLTLSNFCSRIYFNLYLKKKLSLFTNRFIQFDNNLMTIWWTCRRFNHCSCQRTVTRQPENAGWSTNPPRQLDDLELTNELENKKNIC